MNSNLNQAPAYILTSHARAAGNPTQTLSACVFVKPPRPNLASLPVPILRVIGEHLRRH